MGDTNGQTNRGYEKDGGESSDIPEKQAVGEDSGVKLKRELGLLGAFSYVVGSMIGSGIFVSPKGVLAATQSVGMSLVVWLICGVVAVLGWFNKIIELHKINDGL